jgi:predicted nucleotidyltransferase
MDKNRIIILLQKALFPLGINKAILFGSYVKGNETELSDIDLLVVTNDNFIPQSFSEKMKLKIASALKSLRKHFDIDLIVHTKPMHDKFIKQNSLFKNETSANAGNTQVWTCL